MIPIEDEKMAQQLTHFVQLTSFLVFHTLSVTNLRCEHFVLSTLNEAISLVETAG